MATQEHSVSSNRKNTAELDSISIEKNDFNYTLLLNKGRELFYEESSISNSIDDIGDISFDKNGEISLNDRDVIDELVYLKDGLNIIQSNNEKKMSEAKERMNSIRGEFDVLNKKVSALHSHMNFLRDYLKSDETKHDTDLYFEVNGFYEKAKNKLLELRGDMFSLQTKFGDQVDLWTKLSKKNVDIKDFLNRKEIKNLPQKHEKIWNDSMFLGVIGNSESVLDLKELLSLWDIRLVRGVESRVDYKIEQIFNLIDIERKKIVENNITEYNSLPFPLNELPEVLSKKITNLLKKDASINRNFNEMPMGDFYMYWMMTFSKEKIDKLATERIHENIKSDKPVKLKKWFNVLEYEYEQQNVRREEFMNKWYMFIDKLSEIDGM